MAANRVSLLFDIYDGTGSQVNYGHATCTLTTQAVDAPDRMVITSGPVQVPFNVPGTPSKLLLANDSPGPVPQGSAWNLKFAVPGIASCTVQLFAGPVAFTATDASPAVFTWTSAGYLTSLPNGTGVQLSGSSLPGGFSPGVTYFVTGANGSTFQLTPVQGNPPAASTSTGSGTLTVVQYNLSALTQAVAGPVVSPLMTSPSGTPSAGQVPVATGVGGQSAWGDASGASGGVQIGGDLGGAADAPVVEKIQGVPVEEPSGSATQYLDGTGAFSTPVGTGPGLSNPMTAPGDSIYGGSSGTPQRLGGNASATRKFMRQTGDGTTPAAPAWDTLAAGDLPAATTGAAGAVQLAADLGGTATAPLVEKIQGTAIAAPSGGTGSYLNAAGAWTVPPGTGGSGGTLGGYVAPAVVGLTYGTSIAVNAALGNAYNLTLAASTGTIANPSNAVDGQVIRFRIKQDGTGSRTVTWGTAYDFGSGSAPTLSAAANKTDIIAFEYDSGISKWCCLNSGGLGY